MLAHRRDRGGFPSTSVTLIIYFMRKMKRKIAGMIPRWEGQALRWCLCLLACCSSVTMTRAQSVEQPKVSLNVERATLVSVIESLREQTSYNFLFNAADLQGAESVTVRLRNVELRTALDSLLPSRGLAYTLEGRTVVIKKETVEFKGEAITISGYVYDEKRQPMPGVTVQVMGTTLGSVTNEQGRFSISLTVGAGKLRFSFVGYKEQLVDFNNALDSLIVTMIESVEELDEALVVPYGETTRRKSTGSISTVKADEFRGIPSSSIANLLHG